MANRTITLSLKSNVQGLQNGLRTARMAATDAGKQLTDFRKNNEQTWNAAGRGAVAFGTAAVAGLGFAAKAAMDWESAWAGVTKTVDGSPEQMAALEEELRNLATTLPITHAEIAGIAEAAGQLGIAREDIADFTKTMVDLGVSTNLTAEEAATSIAQMMNVMQTAPEDVDNLGSALVALGNNGASTEKDILQMAQRLAGTAELVGASEADVLALANTMSSLGISAEAGGGAMSRVMQDIYTSVQDGGDSLEGFAEVAGVSAEEFATAFREDPVAAVDMFTQGLGRIGEEGGNVVGTLSELGMKSTEETRALLAMAGAGDELTKSLEIGNGAWEANTALTEEASKRYEATEEQIKIAWNGIKDAAIDAGAVLLPMIAGTAETVADLAGVFSSFSPEAQGAITVLGGLAGVGAVAGGSFMLLLPKMQESSRALRSLGKGGEIADKGLRKVGKAATAAGAIGAVGLALAKIVEADYMNDIDDGMGRVSETLIDLANDAPGAGVALDELFQNIDGEAITGEVDSIDDALRRTFNKDKGEEFNDWAENIINGVTGIEGSSQILEGSWDRMDQGLAEMVSNGNTEEAAAAFAEIQEAAEAQGVSVEQLAAIFPLYGDALSGAAAEQSTAAGSGEELQSALGEVGLAADGTVESLGDFIDKMFESGLATMTARDASARFQESIAAADAAVQQIIDSQGAMGATLNKSKTDFDLTTEAGRLANGAFQDITRSGFDAATAMAENGASQEDVQGKLRNTYDSLLTAAEGFGLSEGKARDLTREVLGVPDGVTVSSWMSQEAERTAENLAADLDAVDGRHTTSTHTHTVTMREVKLSSGIVMNQSSGGLTFAKGGRLPGFADGGRLPYTGLGTDQILGVSSSGRPAVRFDDGEWMIRETSARKYDSVLDRINRDHPSVQHLAGYANGGRTNSGVAMAQQFAMATAGAPQQAAPAPALEAGPQEVVGTFYYDNGALAGQFKGMMKHDRYGVTRETSTALRNMQKRDSRH